MRIIVPFAIILSLAACASTPRPVAAPLPPVATQPQRNAAVIGLTASELAARFGTPALQVREGDGAKLQYRGPRCILDAYLYPPPGKAGVARVTHIDARDRDGRSVALSSCIAMLEAR